MSNEIEDIRLRIDALSLEIENHGASLVELRKVIREASAAHLGLLEMLDIADRTEGARELRRLVDE